MGEEAAELMREAEGQLVSRGSWFWKSGPDYHTAAELFVRAANLYKAAKEWQAAGKAFERAAEVESLGGEPDGGCRQFIQAAGCYKRVQPEQAIALLERACSLLVRQGRFSSAAAHEKEIGELWEGLGDLPQAIKAYEGAAERYAGEDSAVTAQTLWLKVASLACDTGDLERAVDIWERTARESAGDSIRRYSVRDHLLRAGLARLCLGDLVGAKRALEEQYLAWDPSLLGTREGKLLMDLTDCMLEADSELFKQRVAEFERVVGLDEVKTRLLSRCLRAIGEEPSLT